MSQSIKRLAIALLVAALCSTASVEPAGAAPSAPPSPSPKQTAQQRWLKSQLIIVDNRTKRLEKRFGYANAPKTLCSQASSAGVRWAKHYCPSWGGGLYLDWNQNDKMFGAAHDALSTALYVIKRRALRPQEMDVYSWGMREWKISESTFERMLDAQLDFDVREMKMLDAAQPSCQAQDWKKCFALKGVESEYEKAHKCDFSKFTSYQAFTSVDEYNDKVVKLHTSPAIAAPGCTGM